MTSPWDARPEIRALARAAGVDLPDGTVDELAAYLRDVHDGALDEGASADAALARARAALAECPFAVLKPHAELASDRRRIRAAEASAPAADRRSLNMIGALRVALRQFRQSPMFAAITVLVLGLGTGAATAVFTVVDAVVLRPLPYAASHRLVTLWDTNADKGLAHDPISPVNFMDYRALPVFAGAAAWWRPGVNLVDPGQDPVRVNTIEVSGNLFEVLGVGTQIGPGFPAGGPLHSNELVAVISDRLWRARYNADPAIVGRPLAFNGTPYTIVGVMPPGFHFPDDVDVWQRLRWDMTQHSRAAHFMEAVLRLADGVDPAQARSAVDTLAQRLQADFASTNAGWGARLVPLLDEQLGYYRPALLVLFGAVALLLAIAVLNVASLLLSRAVARGREMAVRVALGASPRHLVTQLMAESLVLSAAGAALGAGAAMAVLPLLVHVMPVGVPRMEHAGVDARALALCAGIVATTTLVFGLVPALLLLRTNVVRDLKSGERGSSKGARWTYSALVAAEVAMACALLVSSALLVRSVRAMVTTPTGVAADDVVTSPVQVLPSAGRGKSLPEAWGLVATAHAGLLEEIRQQPGVLAAGSTNFLPLVAGWRNPFAIDGEPRPARVEELPQAQMHSVSEGYFETMGVAMLDGRAFTAFDGAQSAPVVVVNEAFARRYLADGRGVGRTLRMWSTGIGPLGVNLTVGTQAFHQGFPFEIVGVVRDVMNGPLGQPVEPAIYFSTRQFPFSEVFVAVKAADRAVAVAAIRRALQKVTPDVPMGVAQTWAERFAARTAEARLLMAVLLFFGGLAGVLAALGVYGLFSWSVALRRRELAIRLTLGARPATVGALVLRQGAFLVVSGLVVGLLLVRLTEAALSRVLFGVTASDAPAMASAAVVLIVAALGACIPPALRAMQVDPAEGLRIE